MVMIFDMLSSYMMYGYDILCDNNSGVCKTIVSLLQCRESPLDSSISIMYLAGNIQCYHEWYTIHVAHLATIVINACVIYDMYVLYVMY